MSLVRVPRGFVCLALVGLFAGAGSAWGIAAMASPSAKAPLAKPDDGLWEGSATDDKYGSTGEVSFRVRRDGRVLRNLLIPDLAGDCPGGRDDTLNIRLPRAKIRPSGRIRGHYVFGDPGDEFLSVVSYSGKFTERSITNGRLYQDNDLNGPPGSGCEVAAASFSAARAAR